VTRPRYIELGEGPSLSRMPILYEDRSVIAIDKPAGWMLVPFTWQRTQRNLQAAIASSIAAGDFWARSRNLKFLRHIHRLDAETTGILLLARSPGALRTLSDLFKSRTMEKAYLAVVQGRPGRDEWTCRTKVGPDPKQVGRMRLDPQSGQEAETAFRVIGHTDSRTLIEARPITGRTHQIRLHLIEAGFPVLGDPLYGHESSSGRLESLPRKYPMALRAIHLAYLDPFLRRPVAIHAPQGEFLESYRFGPELRAIAYVKSPGRGGSRESGVGR